MTLSQKEWNYLQNKFINLIYRISTFIGLDSIAFSFEDSVQELQVTLLEAVETFKKYKLPDAVSKGLISKKDAEGYGYITSVVFSQYLKTALWHKKNKVGKAISTKLKIRPSLSVDSETETFMESEEDEYKVSFFLGVEVSVFEGVEKEIVSLFVNDSKTVRKDGAINYKYVSDRLDISASELKIYLKKLKRKFKKDENTNW